MKTRLRFFFLLFFLLLSAGTSLAQTEVHFIVSNSGKITQRDYYCERPRNPEHGSGCKCAYWVDTTTASLYGLFNATQQKVVFPPMFKVIERVSDELFICKTNAFDTCNYEHHSSCYCEDKYGIWHARLGWVKDTVYKNIVGYDFGTAQGAFLVVKDTAFTLLNAQGKPIFKHPLDSIGEFIKLNAHPDPLALAQYKGKWGILSSLGNWVIPAVYDALESPSFSPMIAVKNAKAGQINLSHQILIPFEYDSLTGSNYGIRNNWLLAKKEGKWGVLNPKPVHPFVWDEILEVQGENIVYGIKDGQKTTAVGTYVYPDASPLPDQKAGSYFSLTYSPKKPKYRIYHTLKKKDLTKMPVDTFYFGLESLEKNDTALHVEINDNRKYSPWNLPPGASLEDLGRDYEVRYKFNAQGNSLSPIKYGRTLGLRRMISCGAYRGEEPTMISSLYDINVCSFGETGSYLDGIYDPLTCAYRYGLSDSNNKELLPPEYFLPDDISEERYLNNREETLYFRDSVLKAVKYFESPLTRLPLKNALGKWGIYGLPEQRWLFNCEWDAIRSIGQGIYWLEKDAQFRWATTEGTLLTYNFTPLNEGLKRYARYLNEDQILPPVLWFKSSSGQMPISTKTGKYLSSTAFDGYRMIGNDSLYIVSLQRKRGILDRWARTILPPEFDSIRLADSFYLAKQKSFWGAFDGSGNEILPCKYDSIRYFPLQKCFLTFKKEPKGRQTVNVFTVWDADGNQIQKANTKPPLAEKEKQLRIKKALEADSLGKYFLKKGNFVIYELEPGEPRTFIVNKYGRKIAEYPVTLHKILENDKAVVQAGEYFGVMDSTGTFLLPPKYTYINYLSGFYFTEIATEKETVSTLYDERLRQRMYSTSDVFGIDTRKNYLLRTGKNGITLAYDFYDNIVSHHYEEENGSSAGTPNPTTKPEYTYTIEKKKTKFGVTRNDGKVILNYLYDSLWQTGSAKKTFNALLITEKPKGKVGKEKIKDTTVQIFDFQGKLLFKNPDFIITNDDYAEAYRLYYFQPKKPRFKEQGLMSADGKIIVKPDLEIPELFTETGNENVLFYRLIQKYGLWNGKNQTASPPIADEILKTNGSYFLFRTGEPHKWGILDAEGKTVLNPEWEHVRFISSEDALITRGGKQGWFRSGRIILEPQYVAMGTLGGKQWLKVRPDHKTGWRLINLNVKSGVSQPPSYLFFEDLQPLTDAPTFYCTFKKDGLYGLLREGQITIPAKYDFIKFLRGDFFIGILKDGKERILNGFTGWESESSWEKVELLPAID